ncbi:MAG: glycosyltransferase family 10 [archaeon]
MEKEIKIKFNKIKKIDRNYFPFKVLFENFDVKIVEDINDADVAFEMACRDGDYKFLKENKKTIIITNEDLFAIKNIFSLIESGINKLGFKNAKYKLMDKLDLIIPKFFSEIPLFYFMKEYLDFVQKIKAKKLKNKYAIIQNNIKDKNIFILPYFLQGYYYDMPKLIKRKNKGRQNRRKFCAFVVSSNSSRERVDFFKKLSKYKKVDSYGKVMNNMGDKIQKLNHLSNPVLFEKYKFVICFENTFSDEYITEKLVNVMFAGAIPIYRGAPNIDKYFNTKSFINYEDYGLYDEMIEKIIELDNDEEKYGEILKEPWFVDNKIPKIFKKKEKELIKFYKNIFCKEINKE